MVTQYLFGFEANTTCCLCAGPIRVIAKRPVPTEMLFDECYQCRLLTPMAWKDRYMGYRR